MSEPLKTNTTAIVAFVASLLGFSCLFGVGGIAAVLLGVLALREIERSQGRQQGKTLAALAIALGLLNLAALLVTIGVGVALLLRPDAPVASRPTPPAPTATAPALPPGHPPLTAPRAPSEAERSPRPLGQRELRVGKVRLVDLNPGPGGLGAALSAQRAEAATAREELLLFTVSADCEPCNGVALALADPLMQRALAEVRLVRVDVADYGPELTALRVPIQTVPGFALLDAEGRIRDYIHGGEWGADIAENIAPVLGAFVRGKYEKRQDRFRGPSRPDETAL